MERLNEENENAYQNAKMFNRLYVQWKDETNRTSKEISQIQSELNYLNDILNSQDMNEHQISIFDLFK